MEGGIRPPMGFDMCLWLHHRPSSSGGFERGDPFPRLLSRSVILMAILEHPCPAPLNMEMSFPGGDPLAYCFKF